MFRHIRRLFETYKKILFESYEVPKPTVYKINGRKYIKVKRLHTKTKSKGPFPKQ